MKCLAFYQERKGFRGLGVLLSRRQFNHFHRPQTSSSGMPLVLLWNSELETYHPRPISVEVIIHDHPLHLRGLYQVEDTPVPDSACCGIMPPIVNFFFFCRPCWVSPSPGTPVYGILFFSYIHVLLGCCSYRLSDQYYYRLYGVICYSTFTITRHSEETQRYMYHGTNLPMALWVVS